MYLQVECNTYACNYDNHECTFGHHIYENCSAIRQGIFCYDLFGNGKCDPACSSADCLWDNFECHEDKDVKDCNPIYTEYCKHHYGNGHCDPGCNTRECGWDGLDCDDEEEDLADGVLVIIVLIVPEKFIPQIPDFLRDLGRLLHTVALIKKDDDGKDEVYPWPRTSDRRKRDLWRWGDQEGQHLRIKRAARGYVHRQNYTQYTRDFESMLVLRWSSVADGGPTLNQRWFNVLC